ncbi:MAG: FAD-dependent oxidoreductase [Gammaproteobacteria bacterium]|nr:FAD-dependent oxidoreductase [Gammaproteobacteria bacterium]MDH5303196.1 FAD-dependent oxidoreductase [Gammaproteobacteria bacterium]MDH5320796.1 FAD-dependent oxidoreductase [Gammaproteobacteria bacterium]
MTKSVVIAGAGHAAGQLVATLKQQRYPGRIVLIGEESFLPYQRPPLSKKYLAGMLDAERLHFKPTSFYNAANIEVHLETRIERIEPGGRRVHTDTGRSFTYDKLVLALGSRARQIPLAGAGLGGVHYLRNIPDVDNIRREIAPGRQLVIVGAGYIGLEVAAVCRELGLDVTVVEMADRVMSRVVAPVVSSFFQQQHEQHGVRFLLSAGLKAIHGKARVTAVETDNGDILPADLVIIGAGIVPNTELAARAGLEVDDGIVVNDQCRTSDSDIYAVGDCTSHPNDIYQRRIRLESVHNALEQAKTAAGNICGNELRYCQVPWFWSDQYDLKLQIAGLSQGFDQTIVRGNPAARKFACLYLREGKLIAVDAVNAPHEYMQARTSIAAREIIDPAAPAELR